MSRQDANAAFAHTSFLYGGNAAYIEDLYARYEADPNVGRRRVAGVLPEPEGRARRRRAGTRSGPSWQRPDWPQRGARRTGLRARRRLGARSRRRSATRSRRTAQARRRRALRRRRAAGDARFDPRPDADPRLPRARPFPRQSRSARPRAAERRGGPRPALLRLHRGRLSTARSSSTTCSGSSSPRCARSSPSCSAPTARRSASSSCTSPTRRRRAGSRSASRGPTRRSPSPARASARSSTSWSRPKASRSSATSSSPAPSASASTAANR